MPKARARATVVKSKRGSGKAKIRHFTPKTTEEYETKVRNFGALAVSRLGDWSLDGHMEMTIDVYLQDDRKRDLDNIEKAISDGLNGVVYNDDSQIKAVIKRGRVDRSAPRVELAFMPDQGPDHGRIYIYDRDDVKRVYVLHSPACGRRFKVRPKPRAKGSAPLVAACLDDHRKTIAERETLYEMIEGIEEWITQNPKS